jgi:HK97 gp10 family phage protein
MATGTTVVVVGIPQAQAKLARVSAVLQTQMQVILRVGALPVMNAAKVLVRKRTGTLARSIHIEGAGNEVTVGPNVVYAAAQEFGRPDMPNYSYTPYLRPAMDNNVAAATAAMSRALAALVGAG